MYGITGNKFKGAHLELSKKLKTTEKEERTLFRVENLSTDGVAGGSEKALAKLDERSVKFVVDKEDEKTESSAGYEALGAAIREKKSK
jgi:hypothetical protein